MNNRKMQFTPGQLRATKALLKFCQEHGLSQFWIERLSTCLTALEEKDVFQVTAIVQLLRHGGMGSFLDWVPRAVFENEDAEYVETLWRALHGYWLEMMLPFKQSENRYHSGSAVSATLHSRTSSHWPGKSNEKQVK